MASEAWTRDLAEREAAKRGWQTYDPTFYGYRSKGEKHPRRYDFMGCIDMIAWKEGTTSNAPAFYIAGPINLIQFCAWGDVSKRLKKIRDNKMVMSFSRWSLSAILVWGFRIKGSDVELREEVVL